MFVGVSDSFKVVIFAQVNEVAFAVVFAVRCSKACNWSCGSFDFSDETVYFAFFVVFARRRHNSCNVRCSASEKVVNMPVSFLFLSEVSGNPSSEAHGSLAQGRTRVRVIALVKLEPPIFGYFYAAWNLQENDESIIAFGWQCIKIWHN